MTDTRTYFHVHVLRIHASPRGYAKLNEFLVQTGAEPYGPVIPDGFFEVHYLRELRTR